MSIARLLAKAVEVAGRVRGGLPMDHAARMARAKDMGFHPSTHYHGTAASFSRFDLTRGGAVSQSRAGGMGVSIAPRPEVANEFAGLAARASGGAARVMPLLVRPGRAASVQLTGKEKNLEVAATLAEAFKGGFDSVVLRNYTTPGGVGGNTVLVVKNPSQLRSTAARFDPRRAGSSNLMAGLAAAAVMPSAYLNSGAKQSAATPAPSPNPASSQRQTAGAPPSRGSSYQRTYTTGPKAGMTETVRRTI